MTEDYKLLPCPFCGGPAFLQICRVEDRNVIPGFVGCASLSGCIMPHKNFDLGQEDLMVKAWNRRAALNDKA